jgi:hypothetical protein
MNRIAPSLILLALALCAASCDSAPPDDAPYFNRYRLLIGGEDVPGAIGEAALEDEIIAVVNGAQRELSVAFESFESERVAEAMIAARDRGVRVRFVGDADLQDQAGVRRLLAADIDAVFGDGPFSYSPEPNSIVSRAGEHNQMAHNFVVADEREVITLSGGLFGEEVHQVGLRITSEDMGKDFTDEFNQMHAGVFATTLSAFNGPIKSITNDRYFYPTNDGVLQVFYGPQERLLKRVIDELYAARASVFIIAESFTNEFIDDALRYKAMNGFEVGVVVDEEGAAAPFSQVERLRDDFDGIRGQGEPLPSIRTRPGIRQTVIIIDADASPINGERYETKIMVLNQPLVASLSFVDGPRTEARPADAFTDGAMWMLTRPPSAPDDGLGDNTNLLIENFEALFNSAR